MTKNRTSRNSTPVAMKSFSRSAFGFLFLNILAPALAFMLLRRIFALRIVDAAMFSAFITSACWFFAPTLRAFTARVKVSSPKFKKNLSATNAAEARVK